MRVHGLGCRVSGFEFRVSDFGFLGSGFGFRVSGFGSRVAGFRFRVSGFGFWVWGVGCRVSGFGFRVSGVLAVAPALPVLPPGRGFTVWIRGLGIRFIVWGSGLDFGCSGQPGGNPGANRKSISHSCYLFEVAFVWELTKETIVLPLGCLQSGFWGSGMSPPVDKINLQ